MFPTGPIESTILMWKLVGPKRFPWSQATPQNTHYQPFRLFEELCMPTFVTTGHKGSSRHKTKHTHYKNLLWIVTILFIESTFVTSVKTRPPSDVNTLYVRLSVPLLGGGSHTTVIECSATSTTLTTFGDGGGSAEQQCSHDYIIIYMIYTFKKVCLPKPIPT